MTKVEITISKLRYAIIFDGHAGREEVCAAISALMFSLEGFLANNEQELFVHSSKMDDPGWGYIMFELEQEQPKISGAFELVMIGLLQIRESYQDYIRVDIKETD